MLEDDLCSKLRVERFTRANSRSSVVIADCVRDYAEAGTDRVGRRSEVLSVEEIECLDANLYLDSFADVPRFEYRKIDIFKPRTKELVPPGSASKGSRRAIGKSVRVDPSYLLVGELMTNSRIGIRQNLGCPLKTLACARVVTRTVNGERFTTVE